MPKLIYVQYFALLRDQRGASAERVESEAATPAQLYAELQSRHGLTLAASRLKVAVNQEFADWEQPLHEGDRVAFLPPVAGG